MISELRSKLPIWNINSFAQYFLETMREYSGDFVVSCDSVRTATNKLYEGLSSVSYLHPYPSEGNYVLSRILHSFTGESLTATLFNEFGMLINNMSTKRGLDLEEGSFVRMASKTAEENGELVRAVQELESTITK
jgi:histidinol-phosphate/aromatic aminotransferase/cobyric acid decarboxylase-like protein